MVSEGEGGISSGNESGSELSCDSDLSDSHLNNLVDNIIGKLSLSNKYEHSHMTIKNRKERVKQERPTDRDSPGTSTSSRHSYSFKPYPYAEDRKDVIPHLGRHRIAHQREQHANKEIDSPHSPSSFSPFVHVDSPLYQPANTFNLAQPRLLPSAQSHDVLTDCRPLIREVGTNQGASDSPTAEDASGNNSEDEYYFGKQLRRPSVSKMTEDSLERLLMEKKGWKIIKVGADGACLFRSVSHQIFGDEENHDLVRTQVIDYMVKNKEHFSQYLTEDFDRYISRKKDATCHGNHVEIQAIAELYNRPVEIYHNSVEPINVFHAEYSKEFPIRLSYHGHVHYNSIVDPFNPSFGHGLGMPNYQPGLTEPDLIARAIHESEATHLEEAILRDKLAETEQREIEQCIENQVVRESYFEYINHISLPVSRKIVSPNTTCSPNSLPSDVLSHPQSNMLNHTPNVFTAACDVASSSKASASTTRHSKTCSPYLQTKPCSSQQHMDLTLLRHIPADMLGMEEDALMAMVLEQSRHEYLESLRSNRKPKFSTDSISLDIKTTTSENQSAPKTESDLVSEPSAFNTKPASESPGCYRSINGDY